MIKKFTSINEVDQETDDVNFNTKITIIGVGGAGTNAVNNMIEMGLNDVNFIVINTDAQSVEKSIAPTKIQIGPKITRGLGAGSKPEIGVQAAEESKESIERALQGTNMLFITCGMGGGTGTGASQVVGKIAREMGILTLAFVTKPFEFEGIQKSDIALLGISELEKIVDSLVVISNQNLFKVVDTHTGVKSAFKEIDNVLYSGVKAITDLIVSNGLVNLDFNDIKSVIEGMGRTMISSTEAEGENRAKEVIDQVTFNPLLEDKSIKGAEKILINVTGGEDMTLSEVNEIVTHIKKEVSQDCFINFGVIFDSNLTGRIRISVVATGVDSQFENEARGKIFDTSEYIEDSTIKEVSKIEEISFKEEDDSPTDSVVEKASGVSIKVSVTNYSLTDSIMEKEVPRIVVNPVIQENIVAKKIKKENSHNQEEVLFPKLFKSKVQDINEEYVEDDYIEDSSSDNLFDLIATRKSYQGGNASVNDEEVKSEGLIRHRDRIISSEKKDDYKEESFFDLPTFLRKSK